LGYNFYNFSIFFPVKHRLFKVFLINQQLFDTLNVALILTTKSCGSNYDKQFCSSTFSAIEAFSRCLIVTVNSDESSSVLKEHIDMVLLNLINSNIADVTKLQVNDRYNLICFIW